MSHIPASLIHPRDLSDSDFARAIHAAQRPDLLRELVDTSRRVFGFYTGHYPHTINYPWMIEHLEHLSSGSRLLDIGAGVSPVPIVLADRGMFVDCVDNNANVRTLPSNVHWNEWGFFDYATVHRNLSAYNCDAAKFEPKTQYEAIYSVSSLVHMPRPVREQTLERCWTWLKPNGLLLLAIDMMPCTDFLWNRSDGLEVEPPVQHGTADDVLSQLGRLGFQIDDWKILRTVYKSRTDLLFIRGLRPK